MIKTPLEQYAAKHQQLVEIFSKIAKLQEEADEIRDYADILWHQLPDSDKLKLLPMLERDALTNYKQL